MKMRKLGQLEVSTLGLGCMGMSEFYGHSTVEESMQTILKAYELGINFFDTADIYGFGDNESLLGETLNDLRAQVIIATKCGIVRDRNDPTVRGMNGKPDYIKKSCEASLKRLGTDYIDLYYLHRVDVNTPIEESMQAFAELVQEGKIRHIGLSEADVDTIKRAHAVHPLAAIQTEYSLWSRGPESDVIPLCRELNIGFVPYSPLGRGFLTGKIQTPDALDKDDFRRHLPRFQEENFEANMRIVADIEKVAKEKNCTPAQLALAWVLAQGEDMVPIPGTKRVKYLEENVAAVQVNLSVEDVEKLNLISKLDAPKGSRYTEEVMKGLNLRD